MSVVLGVILLMMIWSFVVLGVDEVMSPNSVSLWQFMV